MAGEPAAGRRAENGTARLSAFPGLLRPLHSAVEHAEDVNGLLLIRCLLFVWLNAVDNEIRIAGYEEFSSVRRPSRLAHEWMIDKAFDASENVPPNLGGCGGVSCLDPLDDA
jgi:hypothetical protein